MKSKKEFKVGDRVTVSGYCLLPKHGDHKSRECNNYLYNKEHGTIKEVKWIYDFQIIVVLDYEKTEVYCHISQLSHLKKKIRKRLWISPELYKKITDMQQSVSYLDNGETKQTEVDIDKINEDQITTINLAPITWMEFKEVKKCK